MRLNTEKRLRKIFVRDGETGESTDEEVFDYGRDTLPGDKTMMQNDRNTLPGDKTFDNSDNTRMDQLIREQDEAALASILQNQR